MVDLVASGRSSELRTTSWTLTQVGFEGCWPSAESVPPRSLAPSPVTSSFLAGGGVLTLICLSFCFGGFVFRLGGFSLALTGRFTVVPRGAVG